MAQVYVAGPLFNEGERWYDEQIDAVVRAAGFTTFLPHRDGVEGKQKSAGNLRAIFDEDRDNVDAAQIVVANLNGNAVDDGTAWELGYAYAKGKYLIGVRTDWRKGFPDQQVNLMIEECLHVMVRSLEELRTVLADLKSEGE
ncbi:MAG TPA: nucleoside 2-deoxyribosyltransferase [Aggregatilineales bacterium]|nr:nucleoside 2-deoxyribosyltransferase [Aggregatilineales bacterium]